VNYLSKNLAAAAFVTPCSAANSNPSAMADITSVEPSPKFSGLYAHVLLELFQCLRKAFARLSPSALPLSLPFSAFVSFSPGILLEYPGETRGLTPLPLPGHQAYFLSRPMQEALASMMQLSISA